MERQPSVSILICSNKAPATTEALLDSIASQKRLEECEVVFVDNGIEPGRAGEVRERLGSLPCETTYVYEKTPGLWHARKASFESAEGEWLVLLDDDNTLGDDAIAGLLSFAGRHPEAGGVCPRVIARWEREAPDWLQDFGVFFLSFNESGKYGPGLEETVWQPGQAGMRPPGGGMIIRQEAAAAFVENFLSFPKYLRDMPLSCEDEVVYSFVLKSGFSSAYVPTIKVFHNLPKNRNEIGYLTRMNFRMLYAYGLLQDHLTAGRGPLRKLGSVCVYGRQHLASPPFHFWAAWLKLVRVAGFFAGVFGRGGHRCL